MYNTIERKKLNRLISMGMFLIISEPLSSFSEVQIPLWDKNWNTSISQKEQSTSDTSFTVNNIKEGCGPAPNELCISCHELSMDAPDPQIKVISEPIHGIGVYRLSASEYLSVNMHTFSRYVNPKCTVCHFNPKISKKELKSFQYKKMGDKLCFTCHPDKDPANFIDNNENNILQAAQIPKENPIMEELKQQFLSKRASVDAYKKRLKID